MLLINDRPIHVSGSVNHRDIFIRVAKCDYSRTTAQSFCDFRHHRTAGSWSRQRPAHLGRIKDNDIIFDCRCMRVIGELSLDSHNTMQVVDSALVGEEPAWLSHEPIIAKSPSADAGQQLTHGN